MGKNNLDWQAHPAMAMAIEQRELLMMLVRDQCDIQPRKHGRHEAEAALIACGYARIDDEHIVITENGLYFWQSYLEWRGEKLPFQNARARTGFHYHKRGRDENDHVSE
jgi:hypothetical protein